MPQINNSNPIRTRLPPLNALRAFECAARHLSFTRAAAELHVTQAAISHQVKALEEYLGLKLFRRLNRALLLTEEGQAYAASLNEAFALMQHATGRLYALQAASPLTVSVLPSFAARWLVPRLGRFRQRWPDADLLIDPSTRLADLQGGEVDVAIRYGRGRYPGLHAERLLGEALFPVCSPQLLASAGQLAQAADLARLPLLHDDDHGDWLAWLDAVGAKNVQAMRGSVFTDSSLLLQAAIAGQGVAMARGVLADDALREGLLVRPFPQSLPVELAYHLVCLPERAQQPKIARFRDWLMDEASGNAAH